jgi:hypothetical protein
MGGDKRVTPPVKTEERGIAERGMGRDRRGTMGTVEGVEFCFHWIEEMVGARKGREVGDFGEGKRMAPFDVKEMGRGVKWGGLLAGERGVVFWLPNVFNWSLRIGIAFAPVAVC